MKRYATRPAPPVSALGGLSLADLERFSVAVALLSGAFALEGLARGATPSLVVLCWTLFLLDPQRRGWGRYFGAASRGLTTGLRAWGPSLALCAGGWTMELLPGVPLGEGTRELLLAFVSCGLAYLLLPGDPNDARTLRGLPWPGEVP
ncbi:MAG: hypothetical protein KGJ23_02755 [Euryarchaeota archaeon]|nr:hypothetical protein [Euryarchaeota archaeon]MDE1835518.1 hypothetical protein [Euryarchaeota archaeon]MDE1879609.1 hypothetical protein [Euryarchaeota archaeon]MDE2043860.1 hypothetical protein [Thermoplasmata archaeon]